MRTLISILSRRWASGPLLRHRPRLPRAGLAVREDRTILQDKGGQAQVQSGESVRAEGGQESGGANEANPPMGGPQGNGV